MALNTTLAYLGVKSAVLPSTDSGRLQRLTITNGDRIVLAFDDTTEQEAVWTIAAFPSVYQSGTLTLVVDCEMASATTGNVVLSAAVEAITPADTLDLNAAHSYDTANSTTQPVPATAGYLFTTSITLTNKDSVAAADYVRIKLKRVAADGSDTATGDLRILGATLLESVSTWDATGYTSVIFPKLIGGTGSGETLTLQSTSHATKGKVYLGNAQASAYDEVNERLGIGNASPQSALEVSAAADPTIRVSEASSTTSYTAIIDSAATQGRILKQSASGNAFLDFDANPADGSGVAQVRYFRNSTTSGNVAFQVFKGDGTATGNCQIGGNTDTYLNQTSGLVGIGRSSPGAQLHIASVSNALSRASWTVSGIGVRIDAATYTNTSSSAGTVASQVAHAIATPTFASTNTITVTSGATVYIAAAPANGTNTTITNPYSLWVDAGVCRFDGNLDFSASDTTNFVLGTTTGTKIGTSTSQKIGFYNATPVVQQTDGAALTNNVTSGGSTDVIANFTDLSTYANDAATIRNNMYQLARKLKIVDDALRTYGLLS